MIESWDNNAQQRHNQLISGTDITFSHLLAPQIFNTLYEVGALPAENVLEIGCGTGVLTEMISHHANKIVGVDPSPNSIAIARTHNSKVGNTQFYCDTFQDFGKDCDTKFNLAIAHMVLHVIKDIDLCLEYLSKLLNNSSIFLFTIPHPCFWALVKSSFDNSTYSYTNSSYHLNPFTISNDKKPLKNNVPYFHRPLGEYSRILNEKGFLIQRLIEPFPDNDLMKQYTKTWEYPGFSMFVCKKAF